ncbi:MAG: FHA domain-containing protein [Planctomycetota bacterium]|nr:FHA domain-containing protein [Planctomycetota bacterium]
MASLTITSGEQAGTYFQIANRPLAAGRDPARDIQIKDPKVSRKHFQIRKRADDYELIEFKSLNGVLVNGTKIDGEVVLEDGDEIIVGDTTLVFYTSDDLDRSNALHKYRDGSRRLREDRTIID